jgi:aspartate racemase
MADHQQKMIGMLGGMSWQSSAEYYARLVLGSVDFATIERLQVEDRWEEAGQLLAEVAKGLEAAGAEFLLLCANTMHKVADQVQAAVSVPLLHIIDVTGLAVRGAGLSVVGLLGTAYTMEQDFYRDRMASHGVRLIVPAPEDRAEVHRVIYEELVLGVVRDESRRSYQDIIGRLVDEGAEGVVLGCTEIELLITAADSPVPVFATTRLHVEAALAASLGP